MAEQKEISPGWGEIARCNTQLLFHIYHCLQYPFYLLAGGVNLVAFDGQGNCIADFLPFTGHNRGLLMSRCRCFLGGKTDSGDQKRHAVTTIAFLTFDSFMLFSLGFWFFRLQHMWLL